MAMRSAQEAAVARDYRQVDVLRPEVVGLAEVDLITVEIDLADRLHRAQETFAGQVAAGPPQTFDGDFGVEEAFHRYERPILDSHPGHDLLILAHDAAGGGKRKRRDLGYHQTDAFLAECIDRSLRAHHRQREKLP